MIARLLLLYIFDSENRYFCSEIIDIDTEQVIYFSAHNDQNVDKEVMYVYCEGLSYACDVICSEATTQFEIINNEPLDKLNERLIQFLFHTENQILGQIKMDFNIE